MKSEKPRSQPTAGNPEMLLQQLARNPDKLFGTTFRQQCGALCFRYKEGGSEIEVLVITSRESRRWIIPKGWPMKGKKPYEAAAIEAWEEAGVRGKVKKKSVGSYTYLKELDDGNVAPCIVEMFQIEVTEISTDFKERGQRVFDWVSPSEAAGRVREIELKSLLVNFNPNASKARG
ncbi:8-oxo-dGTP pyrophosphatase MutT (NUDIX family) [Ensifer adhaerens]|uniref:8-oxo-dGTP pyrophosphatase MutT (NUDIX family) n=1 Tax=Ensifer adhaerens TaxID=106592 RepID=A0ACC5T5G1_ENSAD|nr:NUDIX hydrolase [Ensifer adhaerens]MBP1876335.1 8-oxo-dGTP pyrophosphatase MutT (NUDIX family) [Ensifer adhaerens]